MFAFSKFERKTFPLLTTGVVLLNHINVPSSAGFDFVHWFLGNTDLIPQESHRSISTIYIATHENFIRL